MPRRTTTSRSAWRWGQLTATQAVLAVFISGASASSGASLAVELVHSFQRIVSQPDVAKYLAKPNDGRKLIFDVGFNDGQDSRFFNEQGFTIVGVDANPEMIAEGKQQLWDLLERNQIVLVHAGIEESATNAELVFWKNNDIPVLSSFERKKSCQDLEDQPGKTMWNCEPIAVPLMRCEALWALGTPYYLKVDIEERHYACIRALRNLPRDMLPQYVSWEMHEYAKNKKYPIIDTQLILMLSELGYDVVKFVAQNEGKESAGLPEDAENFLTSNASWVPVEEALRRGVLNPREISIHKYDHHRDRNLTYNPWFDFHMRLGHPHPATVKPASSSSMPGGTAQGHAAGAAASGSGSSDTAGSGSSGDRSSAGATWAAGREGQRGSADDISSSLGMGATFGVGGVGATPEVTTARHNNLRKL